MRKSVDALKLVGIPGHGSRGVKDCVAPTVINTRLGPGRAGLCVAHEAEQEIPNGVGESLHLQVTGKLAGKVSAGLKLIELVMAL
jgi:hypothetical protein